MVGVFSGLGTEQRTGNVKTERPVWQREGGRPGGGRGAWGEGRGAWRAGGSGGREGAGRSRWPRSLSKTKRLR